MEEPPDPGGTAPLPASFITIKTTNLLQSNESGMDTDGSASYRKRPRAHKLCRHKRRKNVNTEGSKSDCHCSDHDNVNVTTNNTSSVPTTRNNISANGVSSPQTSATNNEVRSLYKNSDLGPYIVHVQYVQEHPNDNATLHPVVFGRFLKKKLDSKTLNSIVNGSVKRIGRNKIALSFHNYDDANTFITHENLSKNKLKGFIPSFNVTRMGIVRGIPHDWTPEEVVENISVPNGNITIVKTRRINYKVIVDGSPTWKPTQSVVITFDGQVLPKYIHMCFNVLPVELYIYPTVQCYNCCRYGHTKISCRSKPRCFRCGGEHNGDSCNIEDENIVCCSCSGFHLATSKSCPEFSRQKKIKMSMAESAISYMEASKLHPSVSKSFADVLKSPPNISSPNYNSSYAQPKTPSSLSYKKTVFAKPRAPPKLSQEYDRVAHENIVKDYNMPSPQDGCALKFNNNSEKQMSVTEIISSIVAPILESIASLIVSNNGQQQGHSTAVELQKYN